MANITFKVQHSEFAVALREQVNEYFKTNNIRKTGNWKLYSKTIILFGVAIACYGLLVFANLHWAINVGLCIVLGFDLSAIGFNVMHDGSHGSYSRKKWVNDIMAFSLNLMGGNAYLWNQKHNVIHHNFTNIEGYDDDIDIRPLIRTNENQKKLGIHKYQHIYFIFLYALTSIWWVYVRDFLKYFSGKIANHQFKKMTAKDHIVFWISKIIYFGIFLVIPMYFAGVIPTIVGYLITFGVQGIILSVIFQMAHVVEGPTFPKLDESTMKIENTVVLHQLETTANFSTKSPVMYWFTGGLNFQIEHHLFPKVSHVHYGRISKIVKDLCKKYNVTYHEYPTLFHAFKSHIVHLKMVGNAA